MADFIFVYFKNGSHVGSTPWSGDLETAKNVAREGLMRAVLMNFKSDPALWADRWFGRKNVAFEGARALRFSRLVGTKGAWFTSP
jgi:hypothetical protein